MVMGNHLAVGTMWVRFPDKVRHRSLTASVGIAGIPSPKNSKTLYRIWHRLEGLEGDGKRKNVEWMFGHIS